MTKKDTPSSSGRPEMPPPREVAPTARRIMRLADKVAIATIERETGSPFLSLTGVATLMDVTPVLLLSDLSRHSQNLARDSRASLLFDGTGDHANPLTEARVSVNGRIEKSTHTNVEQRFMAKHPKAFYASFADFSFYQLHMEEAHFVGGFGTALSVPADILRVNKGQLAGLLGAELDILEHMNEQHADAVGDMAVHLAKGSKGSWQLTGIDPEGCDFMAGKNRLRLDFPSLVTTASEAHDMLVSLARLARSQ